MNKALTLSTSARRQRWLPMSSFLNHSWCIICPTNMSIVSMNRILSPTTTTTTTWRWYNHTMGRMKNENIIPSGDHTFQVLPKSNNTNTINNHHHPSIVSHPKETANGTTK